MRVLMFAALAITALAEDRQAARRLLDSVPELVAAVHAETGVVALWRAGGAYAQLDKSKALDYLSQAFSASSALPENAQEYRSGIVKTAADVSLPDAIEMLRGLKEPAAAADYIVGLLAAKQEFDRAIEILALMPDSAEYPFRAAGRIFEKLPAGDSRRLLVFGRAVTAYSKRLSGSFADLLERYGNQVSQELAAQGVAAIARRIAEWKDDTNSFRGEAGNEGQLEMHSPNQVELRELMSVLRQFDAKRADDILASRTDIRAALGGFRKERKPPEPDKEKPEAEESADEPGLSPPLMMGFAGDFTEFTKQLQEWSALAKRGEKVFETLKKDPDKALEQARELPGGVRAEVVAKVARSVAANNPEWARSILETCLSLLRDVRQPAERVMPEVAVAETLHELKEAERSWEAFERALDDLTPVYRQDTNAERPNRALRDHWPSIQGCRVVMWRAAKLLGAKSESLLAGIQVVDLALVARVEVARALLGQPLDVHSIDVRW